MEITVDEIMARVEEQKQAAISGLASQEGSELHRFQGDYRTLEWLIGLPEQIKAEREFDEQRQNDADDV